MGTSEPHLPFVSVVVPVLDARTDVVRLLESFKALDYPEERRGIVVVDNGSVDGTPEVTSRYPVTLLRESGTRSSYAARNRGVAGTSGEWVAFTDADCFVSPDWLRRLLDPAPPPEIGAVAGEILALEETTPVQRLTERYGIMKHGVTMHHKALPGFSTANVAIRRDVLETLRGFRADVRYFGDMELAWRMQIELGLEILYRPDAVVFHRHRRTWRDLWKHGRQHGRGTAFMRRTYPDRYRIHVREQLGRIAGIAGSVLRAPGSRGEGRPDPDRWYAPLFLILWYLGMAWGYFLGPAPSKPVR